MPSNRPITMLRWRTKKQKAGMERIAKQDRFSLNEYILRVLEEKQVPTPRQAEHSIETVLSEN